MDFLQSFIDALPFLQLLLINITKPHNHRYLYFFINSVFLLMSLSQNVVHVMASLQPWFSMSIVRAALNTNPRVFVTYNSGSLRYM